MRHRIVFLVLACVTAVRSAHACGAFFARDGVPEAQRPSLAHEQVLIVHDPRTQREHFIRQVAFRRAGAPFGFVVPTPSRPEVAKVASPFDLLDRDFWFYAGSLAGVGLRGGMGGGGAGVQVLEVSRVGSFTAFVLAADDAGALVRWLGDNGFVSTPATDGWLARYVRLHFFYVAMRYEPPAGADAPRGSVDAETIRISFSTPLPYYPYSEPQRPAPSSREDRLVDLWVIGPAPVAPLAARASTGGAPTWIRPMGAGAVSDRGDARDEMSPPLLHQLESLLPPGPLVVQTFQDQKVSRAGIGDVLFAPVDESGNVVVDRLRSLLAILAPAGARPPALSRLVQGRVEALSVVDVERGRSFVRDLRDRLDAAAEWSGQVTAGQLRSGKTAAPARVRGDVLALLPAFRACYRQAWEGNATLAGTITFDFTIGTDGHVTAASARAPTLLERDVVPCMLARLRRRRFPDQTAPLSVTLPLTLAGP